MAVRYGHLLVDTAFVGAIGAIVLMFVPGGFSGVDFGLAGFPDHYQPVFDFITTPMSPALGLAIWLLAMYFLLKSYVLEKNVVGEAHKKYRAHGTRITAIIHGTGSALELTLGLCAILSLADTHTASQGAIAPNSSLLYDVCRLLRPYQRMMCQACAVLAMVNVATGLILNPGVFGIKVRGK